MGMTPEGKIKKKIDAMLKAKGKSVWFFKPQAGPFGRSGVPDYIVCVTGHFIGIEAKANPTRKPTALQHKCMQDIAVAGGVCFVVFDEGSIAVVSDFIDATLKDFPVSFAKVQVH